MRIQPQPPMAKEGASAGTPACLRFCARFGLLLAILLLAACQSTGAGDQTAAAPINPAIPPLDSGTAAAARAASQVPNARVLVVYTHPENFLDIRDRVAPSDEGENAILSDLRAYITKRAPLYLHPGGFLYVNFINIKLAGVYPVGAIGNLDQRTILSTTPPMFMFSWAVVDPAGKIIGSASEKLEENDFKDLYRSADAGDPLRYEKAVLDDWMRNHL
jgi:hypothetical protein